MRNTNKKSQGIYISEILKNLQVIALKIKDAPDKTKIKNILKNIFFNLYID